ncbi:MAG: site-2 protease family protein, partial [Bacteroidetes bacterium]|nr:site-2 protease family protein [Bacteroidota bacterium]
MPESFTDYFKSSFKSKDKEKKKDNYLLHIGLFIVTFITTTIAGVQWTTGQIGPYELDTLMKGLPYSLSIMTIISFHEFGHFFAAKFHRIKVT